MRQYRVAHCCVNDRLYKGWVHHQLRKYNIIRNYDYRGEYACSTKRNNMVEYVGEDRPIRLWRKIYKKVDSQACSRDFYEECQRFANSKFKETNNVFYCDILRTKDPNQLTAYCRNENIMSVLTSDKFAAQFPIFKEILRERLSSFCHRNFRLKRVNDFFLHLSTMEDSKLPGLPADCANHVFKYLNNADLDNLRKAYRLKSEVLSKLWKTAKQRLNLRQPVGDITYHVIFALPKPPFLFLFN